MLLVTRTIVMTSQQYWVFFIFLPISQLKCVLCTISQIQLFQQFIRNMKLLEEQLQPHSNQAHMLGPTLNSVFESQGMRASPSLNPSKSQYCTHIYLVRAQTFLNVIWQCKITQKILLLDLQLSPTPHGPNRSLLQFLKDHHEQVHQFIYLINNLNLTNPNAYFIFDGCTGQITLRYKITKFRFLSSKMSLVRYFNRCIQLSTAIFIQEIQNIIFYYQLLGFSLPQLETQAQNANHVPLIQQRQIILLMQQCFSMPKDYAHTTRGSGCSLADKIYSLLVQMNTLLDHGDNQTPQAEQKISLPQLLKYEVQSLLLDINNKKEGAESILTSIRIKEKSKQALIGEGGYASIIHGIYSYIPEISVYSNTFPQIQIDNQQGIIKNCSLVKKVSFQSEQGKANIPLQNECHFLMYMRNKVCPYIAKYYCNSNISGPFSDGEIYLQYYPKNLAEAHLNEQRKMKVMEDICLALLFLNEEKIIHRDLKEMNIMVDKYSRGRLIDFGSVSSINGHHRFQTKDQKIRSTPGYYLPYQEAVALYPQIQKHISKHDYYTHQTYDLYGLGRIMERQFSLGSFIDSNHFVRYNLRYLCDKCREVNPEDRWNIQQVLVFLRHIIRFSELRKQFWKRGFDRRYMAHQLGRHYDGNGGYIDRNQKAYFSAQTSTSRPHALQGYLPN